MTHVKFGTRIIITLSGPKGQRDATAMGMDDVPAVYSQMVRSLLRGEPMEAPGVVDRTNVSATQAAPPNRPHSTACGTRGSDTARISATKPTAVPPSVSSAIVVRASGLASMCHS